jgi:hypothetical protein
LWLLRRMLENVLDHVSWLPGASFSVTHTEKEMLLRAESVSSPWAASVSTGGATFPSTLLL